MTVLAVDLGGTKTLLALVNGAEVIDRAEIPTARNAGPKAWVHEMARIAERWRGQFDQAGITVTGLVKDNKWQSLNPETLAIPGCFALHEAADRALGVPVTLCNDAQAAAWGEYLYGAGQGKDIAFLTISTGVGGGVVSNGRLLSGRSGLAGHFGQIVPLPEGSDARFEDGVSGNWIAAEGEKNGHAKDARAVFAAAASGDATAEKIIQTSAQRVGRLCRNLQLMLDPDLMVIGGGVGLAPGYIKKMAACVEQFQSHVRPAFVQAKLGKDAGIVGVADMSTKNQLKREEAK